MTKGVGLAFLPSNRHSLFSIHFSWLSPPHRHFVVVELLADGLTELGDRLADQLGISLIRSGLLVSGWISSGYIDRIGGLFAAFDLIEIDGPANPATTQLMCSARARRVLQQVDAQDDVALELLAGVILGHALPIEARTFLKVLDL